MQTRVVIQPFTINFNNTSEKYIFKNEKRALHFHVTLDTQPFIFHVSLG